MPLILLPVVSAPSPSKVSITFKGKGGGVKVDVGGIYKQITVLDILCVEFTRASL